MLAVEEAADLLAHPLRKAVDAQRLGGRLLPVELAAGEVVAVVDGEAAGVDDSPDAGALGGGERQVHPFDVHVVRGDRIVDVVRAALAHRHVEERVHALRRAHERLGVGHVSLDELPGGVGWGLAVENAQRVTLGQKRQNEAADVARAADDEKFHNASGVKSEVVWVCKELR